MKKGRKILNKGSPTSHFAVFSRLSRQALCRRQMGDFDGAIKACEEGLSHYTTSASEPMQYERIIKNPYIYIPWASSAKFNFVIVKTMFYQVFSVNDYVLLPSGNIWLKLKNRCDL